MPEGGIGASVKRKEDFRFLTGRGSYTDDEVRAGQLYAHMLRSPHGHAALGSVDTSKAEAAPGVVCGPDRSGRRRGRDRRPALRLGHHVEGRHPDGRAQMAGHRPGQGALCRRDRGRGRSPRPRNRRRTPPNSSRSTTRPSTRRRSPRPPIRAGRRSTRRRPTISASTGISPERKRPRRSTPLSRRRRTPRGWSSSTSASSRIRWSRARRWPSTTRARRSSPSTAPPRPRTRCASCSAPSCSTSPSTSSGWSRPTSGAASDPRSRPMPNTRSSAGPRAGWSGRCAGWDSAPSAS